MRPNTSGRSDRSPSEPTAKRVTKRTAKRANRRVEKVPPLAAVPRRTIARRTTQRFVSAHAGLISRRAALIAGVSPSTIRSLVRSDVLVPAGRGIYRSAAWPETERQRGLGLCLVHPTVMLSHTAAGRDWGYRGMIDHRLHVLCPHGSSPQLRYPDMVVHRCRRIDAVDVVEREDGLRLTSPPRTIFDASFVIGVEATVSVIEQAISDFGLTLGTLQDTCIRLFHPRRPGSLTMQAALNSRPPWREAMQSGAEVQMLQALERSGFPQPVTQCPVTLRSGRVIHLDFGWPDWEVGVEVDHPFWHDFESARRRDKRRDLESAAVGWITGRISTSDIGPGHVAGLDELRAVLLRRGWRP